MTRRRSCRLGSSKAQFVSERTFDAVQTAVSFFELGNSMGKFWFFQSRNSEGVLGIRGMRMVRTQSLFRFSWISYGFQ